MVYWQQEIINVYPVPELGAEAMSTIITAAELWLGRGEQVALATVVRTWGSAPRRVGAKMAVSNIGKMSGSVSGGCVEGAVVEAAEEVLKSGRSQLLHFGVSDETAWDIGLACGGEIDVFVQPLCRETLDVMRGACDSPSVTLTVVRGLEECLGRQMLVYTDDEYVGSLGCGLDETALVQARTAMSDGYSRRLLLEDGTELFIEVNQSPPTLVVVGGVHIALPLVAMAKAIGYRTVVVDPRRSFGSAERFPDVDLLLKSWPDRALTELQLDASMAVAVLTHDPKLDDPALNVALSSRAFYVGALGSRNTNAKRRERLLAAGLAAGQLERLRAPIGLDIGGHSPGEIALSVLAEIVAVQHQQKGVGV